MSSLARLGQLLRTTTFRLTAVFILIFIVFAVLLLAFITFQSSIVIQRQQAADIDREVTELKQIDTTQGVRAVVFAVDRLAALPGPRIYYLGDREWTPQLSGIEWDFAANRSTGIFALALRKDVADPFAPRNDSASAEDKKDDADKKDDGKGKDKSNAPGDINDRIDFDGLDGRVIRAPIDPDNIAGIAITKKAILYVVGDAPYYGREGAFKNKLKSWSFEERKSDDVFEDFGELSISDDGGTALLKSEGAYKWIDLNAGKPEAKGVKTDGLFALVDPKQEYADIFGDVWRRYRSVTSGPGVGGDDDTRREPTVVDPPPDERAEVATV